MKRRNTSQDEPSKASLREMPEIDFSKQRPVSRGRHAAKARRSLEILVIDKKVSEALGGPTAIIQILNAIAQGLADAREPKRKRRAA